MASLSAAFAPQQVPPDDDDGAPLRPPMGVTVASVLSILAGAIYMFSGGLGVATVKQLIADSRLEYQRWVGDCVSQFGGIGTGAVTETSPTGAAATCQALVEMGESDWEAFRLASIVVSAVFLAMGIAVVLAGWFLRFGAMWARRVVIAVTIVTVLAAMMLGMTSPLVLGGALLMMAAVVLCYLSTGGLYFLRVRARRHA